MTGVKNTFTNGLHYMFDFETTGLNPELNGIIEIGIVCFSFSNERIMLHDSFAQATRLTNSRIWDQKTFEWHNNTPQKTAQLAVIAKNSISAEHAFTKAVQFVENIIPRNSIENQTTTHYFWAKPSHFDWSFWVSHLAELHLTNPFHYRNVIDLRSFIHGFLYEKDYDIDEVNLHATNHTALGDARVQVGILQNALKKE